MENKFIVNVDKKIKSAMLLASISGSLLLPSVANAFPVYAQQAYENPREATGRIVCANCHLGSKPTEVEVPQGVLPDTVFEAVVEIPYDKSLKQVTGDGSKGPLNVGAVVVLPEGFKLAPKERLSDELKKATEGVVISPYSDSKQNILVVGPIPGDNHQKIVFPILAPNPAENRDVHFIKYPIYVGGNRGRGQVQPTGEKSNNTLYTSPVSGQLVKVESTDKITTLTINSKSGEAVNVKIPVGPEIIVKEGADIKADQPLTLDPNVGGFGQAETEVVLQSPARVKGLIAFFFTVIFAQVLLVLKKKQFEKVQLAEMNF
jgi:apocytochrome f